MKLFVNYDEAAKCYRASNKWLQDYYKASTQNINVFVIALRVSLDFMYSTEALREYKKHGNKAAPVEIYLDRDRGTTLLAKYRHEIISSEHMLDSKMAEFFYSQELMLMYVDAEWLLMVLETYGFEYKGTADDTVFTYDESLKTEDNVLNYVRYFRTAHDYGPSYQDIMDNCRIKSKSSVCFAVENLVSKNKLTKVDNVARSLNVVT